MKNIGLLLVTLTMIVSSCGEETSEVAAKKKELEGYKAELQELKLKITQTEKILAELDSTFGENDNNAVLITAVKVAEMPFIHKIEARGSVESRTNVMLSAEIPGKINSIKVKEGQSVTKGQTLATLDADIYYNTIAELKTQLELATIVAEKQAKLWKQNIGTEIKYLEANANKESLERKLATANSQLNQTIIKAPFSGTIDAIPAKTGEMTQPGSPLIRIVKPQDIHIQADISEKYIGAFKKGDEVEVYFPSQDKRVKSMITSVSQVINTMNRNFSIEVKVPTINFPVRPNQVVVLSLTDYTNATARLVPTRIIQNDDEGNFVFIIEDNQAKKAHVTIGKSYDNQTEVLTGLPLNTLVANDGYRELAEGVKVRMDDVSNISDLNTSK